MESLRNKFGKQKANIPPLRDSSRPSRVTDSGLQANEPASDTPPIEGHIESCGEDKATISSRPRQGLRTSSYIPNALQLSRNRVTSNQRPDPYPLYNQNDQKLSGIVLPNLSPESRQSWRYRSSVWTRRSEDSRKSMRLTRKNGLISMTPMITLSLRSSIKLKASVFPTEQRQWRKQSSPRY